MEEAAMDTASMTETLLNNFSIKKEDNRTITEGREG